MQLTDWSRSNVLFALRRLRERLWARPLAMCLLSIVAVFCASLADQLSPTVFIPPIAPGSLQSLLTIQASSMMVIATFAVASMVSAYASASNSATPRAFALVVADDMSQNALSTFIGAFIFSIVALTASQNGFFERAGLFALFVMTLLVFAAVILTFVGWVDRIARLGRMGTTIAAVESATAKAMRKRQRTPLLGGAPVRPLQARGEPVYASRVGYVQHIDVDALQACTEQSQARVQVSAVPGTFAAPGVVLAYLQLPPGAQDDVDRKRLAGAFLIGTQRQFDEDPRFGLIVLSQIAGRVLSPAVNDPGTAIDVIGTLVRLFTQWAEPAPADVDTAASVNDRVEVPALAVQDMFDDAFISLARDGAGSIEVAMRLQKALWPLAQLDDVPMGEAAKRHARTALQRARLALVLPHDVTTIESIAAALLDSDAAATADPVRG
jgi:uncharacterized membrane protein